MRWPFVSRSQYERVSAEKSELMNALRAANEELRKHRRVIADIRDGDGAIIDRIMAAKARTG